MDLVGLDRNELWGKLKAIDEKPFRVKQLWHWMYFQGKKDFAYKPIDSALLGLLLWPYHSNEHKPLNKTIISWIEYFKQIIKEFF